MSNLKLVNKDDSQVMPSGWSASKLGELGRYLNGRGFKKSEWGTTGRPIIRIQDLTGTSSNPNYFDGEVEDRHVVRDGDFLISWAATLGAYIYRGPEGLVNQHIFKVDTYINQAFHYYAVTFAIGEMYRRTRGTGMVHIVKSDFDDTNIPLPPLNEQERIVDRIEELFTDLDAGIAALERVKRNLSRYRAAVLHAAVTGRLTEEWRKEHGSPEEPASELLERILEERRKQWEAKTLAGYEAKGKKPPKNWKGRYKEPATPTKAGLHEETEVTLPADWCWASGNQLIAELRSGSTLVPIDTPTNREVLRSSCVRPGTITLSDTRYVADDEEVDEVNYVRENDLFFVRLSGSLHLVAACGLVRKAPSNELIYPDRLFAARVVEESLSEWLCIVFQSRIARDRIEPLAKSTAGHKRISMGGINDQKIPLPPLGERKQIVTMIEQTVSEIDNLESETLRGLSRASRLRQAILKAAFEGKLVPQDPNDEPASVLLKRIREQAAKTPKAKRKTRKKSSRKAATT